MATGAVDNWLNIDQFGAIYPFAGSEVLLAILGIAFWINSVKDILIETGSSSS